MDNMAELKEKYDLLARRVRKHGLRGARELRERDLEELLKVAEEISEYGRISEAYALYAVFFIDQGKVAKAVEPAEKALSYAERVGDDQRKTAALAVLGTIKYSTGEFDRAKEILESALKLAKISDAARELPRIYTSLGNLHAFLRDFGNAESYYREALSAALGIGDRKGQITISTNIGHVCYCKGEYEKSISAFKDAQRLADEIGYERAIGYTTAGLGTVFLLLGMYEDCLDVYEKAVEYHQSSKDVTGEGIAYLNMAQARIALGELDEARRLCERVYDVFKPDSETRDEMYLYYLNLIKCDLALAEEDAEEALAAAGEAVEIASKLGFGTGMPKATYRLAQAELAAGREDRAVEYARAAVESADRNDEDYCFYCYEYYRTLKTVGDLRRAVEFLGDAYESVRGIADRISDDVLKGAYLNRSEVRDIISAMKDEGTATPA
jgi:tetratricopeptide (TPR) repeat protein